MRDRGRTMEQEEAAERFTLHLPGPLLRRIEALIDAPELGFTCLEHFLMAGLHSFVAYKERQIERLKGDARW